MSSAPITSNTGTGILSSLGVGSNLDINGIISQLMQVAGQPLTQLQAQGAKYNAELTAYGQLNSAMAAFAQTMQTAAQPGTWQAMQAASSDTGVVTATASTSAQAGTHSLTVSSMAQAQTLDSADLASASTVVGTGTLTIQFGTYNSTSNTFTPNSATTAHSITLDSSDDTLNGLVNAINGANAGVTASIVNDGTGNRLVVTANNTGTANSIKITAADSSGNPLTANTAGTLGQFAYDPTAATGAGQNLTQTAAAKDAQFSLDGINITKSSNTVTDALPGVTLTLQANSGSSTISVSQNDTAVSTAVQNFVSAYNSLIQTMGGLTSYNATTQSAGLLNGDATAGMIQQALPMLATASITGLSGALKSLSQIGVTFQKDGTLAVDSTTLNSALASNFNDVAGLFAAVGSTTDSLVQYAGTTDQTKPGTYAVNVTQLATQGTAVGSAPAALTVTAGSNDTLTVNLDGTTGTVTLVPGTYASASALAAQIQSQINGLSTFSSAGLGVTVSADGSGTLTVTSNSYGATSQAQLSGDAVSSLFGTPTQTSGVDVAGTINGVAATGQGQYLTGAATDASAGLALKIVGGSTGSRGTVSYSQGLASQMSQFANSVTDPLTGMIATAEQGVNSSITNVNNQITAEQSYLSQVQATYTQQFVALDSMLSSMNSTSSFLNQQLNSMPWSNTGKNSSVTG